MPNCTPAHLDYLDRAPYKEVNVVDLPATPEQVFAVFKDGEAWPKWFHVIDKVTWTSPEPYGVGTTRTVHLGPLKADEYFFNWEENRRFSFYFSATNLPFMKTLVEDYLLEAKGPNTTRFTYTVAYEPALPLKLSGPVGRAILARSFKRASRALVNYLQP
ncbi:SRPBCC family protein [Marinobacter mobilis]|uniref:Polyketide cyclase / dehydrase and lipid transport n=1 Tax=Marinobacter mobilis TaxID=488533 RepID=A0A1H2SD86_9GAMM|nr:SRPBCC family protein [Marinobacter mobilis]SDW29094.1 Polyketide cyclase / dehydrase and lipid transport [Marinobacter mobilis]